MVTKIIAKKKFENLIFSQMTYREISRLNRISLLSIQSHNLVSIDVSLTVKAVTLIFISGRCLAISSAKQGKSDSIYNLVKN